MKQEIVYLPTSNKWLNKLFKTRTCVFTMLNIIFLLDSEEVVVDGITLRPGQCIIPVETAFGRKDMKMEDIISDLKYLHKEKYIIYSQQNGKHIAYAIDWKHYLYGSEGDGNG